MNTFQILDTIRTDLHRRYGHELAADEINHVFNRTVDRHTRSARLFEYLPVLVERDATEQLEGIILDQPMRPVTKRRTVLFVDRDNAVVAEAAAALTRRMVGETVEAVTAPTHPENASDRRLEEVAGARNLRLTGETFRSHRPLDAPDVTVYLGAGETADMGGRHEVTWDLPSTNGMNADELGALLDDLEARVAGLVDELDVAPATRALAS